GINSGCLVARSGNWAAIREKAGITVYDVSVKVGASPKQAASFPNSIDNALQHENVENVILASNATLLTLETDGTLASVSRIVANGEARRFPLGSSVERLLDAE